MLVGYMRVSSETDRQTTDLQRDALLAAGVDPRQLFTDQASGVRDDRPGLQQALAYVHPGDCLIVWKLDRLGRSLPHLLQIVLTLQTQGVAFRSLTEQMDTTTPHGAFLFSLFGALAQYERALTQERIMAGLAAAKRRGKHGGRPRAISAEQLEAILAALPGWRQQSRDLPDLWRETEHPRGCPGAGRRLRRAQRREPWMSAGSDARAGSAHVGAGSRHGSVDGSRVPRECP